MVNAAVISEITTPLSLAALGLLVSASLIRIILRRSTATFGKAVIQYGFWLSVVLVVASNLVFAYQQRLSTGHVITGVVLDKDGYLPHAIVDIHGKDRAITDHNGEFSLIVPRALADDTYDIKVSLHGYDAKTEVVGAADGSVAITLTAKRLTADELLTVSPPVLIAHYVGLPQANVELTMMNPTSDAIEVRNILLHIAHRETKMVRVLHPQFVNLDLYDPYRPAFRWVSLEPAEARTYTFIFLDVDAEVQAIQAYVNTQIARLGAALHPGMTILEDAYVDDIRGDMNLRFFWKPGSYDFTVSCTVAGRRYDRTGSFHLTQEDVDNMIAIEKYYPSGHGLIVGQHLSVFKDARPAVFVLAETR